MQRVEPESFRSSRPDPRKGDLLSDATAAETIRPETARAWLRRQTADAHAEVDRLFGRFDLTDRGQYAAFLAVHAAALLPLEQWLETRAGQVIADWPARRRAPHLRADLAALGRAPAPPAASLPFSGGETPAAIAGLLYVLEGSRLGGRMLARLLPVGFPRAYLDPAEAPSWPGFLALLDERLATPAARAEAGRAALAAFACFAEAARPPAGTTA